MDEIDYSKALPPNSKLPQKLEEAVDAYVRHVTALVLFMAVKNTTVASLEPADLAEGRKVKHALKLAFDEEVATLTYKHDNLKFAFDQFMEKTEWVQEESSKGTIGFNDLGMHRADVMTRMIRELRASAESAYGAGFEAGKKAAAS